METRPQHVGRYFEGRTSYLNMVDFTQFEDEICLDNFNGQEAYELFSHYALNSEYGRAGIANIKEITNFESYANIVSGRYIGIMSRSNRDTYLKVEFDGACKKTGLPFYYPPYVVGEQRKEYPSKEQAIEVTNKVLTGRQFFVVFRNAMGKATNIEEFKKRAIVATDPYCISQALENITPVFSKGYSVALVQQLEKFIIAHPQDGEEAFNYWQDRIDTLLEIGLLNFHANHFREYGQGRDIEELTIGENEYKVTSSRLLDLIRVTREPFTIPSNKSSLPALISHSEIPNDAIGVEALAKYEDVLINDPPKGKAKMIQHGIDIMMNFLRFSSDFSNVPATIQTALLNEQKSKGTLSFTAIIRLANLLKPKIPTEIIGNVSHLDERQLRDLPLAIDRICFVCTQDMQIDEEDRDITAADIMDRLGKVASLSASIGAERKLAEKVLTIGDLIVRYPHASAKEISSLADSMQRTKSEQSVHQTYRYLRALNRNRAHFNKFVPGYGLLS